MHCAYAVYTHCIRNVYASHKFRTLCSPTNLGLPRLPRAMCTCTVHCAPLPHRKGHRPDRSMVRSIWAHDARIVGPRSVAIRAQCTLVTTGTRCAYALCVCVYPTLYARPRLQALYARPPSRFHCACAYIISRFPCQCRYQCCDRMFSIKIASEKVHDRTTSSDGL
jgi:hypothetical protein